MKFIVEENSDYNVTLVPQAEADKKGAHLKCDCRRIELSEAQYAKWRELTAEAAELSAMAYRIIAEAERTL